MHGGKLAARALKKAGVECVFTLSGGHVMPIYDGCLDDEIRVIDTRHEQTAGHAADGYARVTGKPGVCAQRPLFGCDPPLHALTSERVYFFASIFAIFRAFSN